MKLIRESNDIAQKELKHKLCDLITSRDDYLKQFQMGRVDLDSKITALSVQIENITAVLNAANTCKFYRGGKNLYVRIPITVEQYYKDWNGNEWVISGPSTYDSVGDVKPHVVPANKQFISSNYNAVKKEVDELNVGECPPITCKMCGKIFGITPGEYAFYKRKGLLAPKRCGTCRNKRKTKQEV